MVDTPTNDAWLTPDNRRHLADERKRIYGYFACAPVAFAVVQEPEHRFIVANERFQKLVSTTGLLGHPLRERITDQSYLPLFDKFDTAFASGDGFFEQEREISPGVFVNVLVQPFRDEVERIAGLIVILNDVTFEVTARSTAERRLNTLANVMPQIVWMANDQGTLTYTNVRWTEFSGSTEPSTWLDFVHPEDRPDVVKNWMYSVSTGETYEARFRLRRIDGAHVWHLVRAERFRAEGASTWYGTCTNISELNDLQNKLSTALDISRVGFWSLDFATGRVTLSEQMAEDWGVNLGSFDGTVPTIMNRIHRDDLDLIKTAITQAVEQSEPYIVQYRVVHPSGRIVHIEARGKMSGGADGHGQLFSGTSIDITDKVLATQELNRAKLDAEVANESKSTFLANMSHEIRTPLGAILGFAEFLRHPGQSPEEINDCVETIARNGDHLLNIVNDILDLSKVESGKFELEVQRTSLSDLMNETYLLLRKKAAEKQLTFSMQVVGDLPRFIRTDPTRLKQVLINIIGNAIKFTEYGYVEVSVSLQTQLAGASPLLQIKVKDSGCGLSVENANRLFEPFMQADTTTSRKFGGTGLGLALSRRLARAMSGDLKLQDSVPGQGATFIIWVSTGDVSGEERIISFREAPQRSSHDHIAIADSGALAGLSILVVEDTIDNQRLISRILQTAGATVALAANGLEGVTQGLAEPFDAILMDIQMPELDGYEATRRLRSGGFSKPIIALTAHAMLEERRRCLDAGCNDNMTKPIDQRRLVEMLARYVERSGSQVEQFDVDDDILADILAMFIAETFPQALAQIATAILSRDHVTVARQAHILMGSVAVYKERRLGIFAKELELEAKGAARQAEMLQLLSQLRKIYESLSSTV